MSTLKDQCKKQCRDQVMAAGVCESCDEVGGEQHYGLHRGSQRAKLNPGLLLDPDMQYDLCPECHKYAPDAPHVDDERFLDKMTAKGGHRAYKAAKIRKIKTGPIVIVPEKYIDYAGILTGLSGDRLAG